MTSQERDLECLLRLRSKDASGLEALYDVYGGILYGVALRILRSASDAEDVVQEAWAQVWKSSASYDARRGTVAAWLMTIARTRALDRYRSTAARQRAHAAAETHVAPPPAAPDPSLRSEQSRLVSQVRQALDRLPEEHQRVLELAYFGGLSQTEIATQLGKPLGTVKSWTRQGLLRLRDALPQAEWGAV
jgi:RNA polymerase sigma-70 factor (ECF subfamily)